MFLNLHLRSGQKYRSLRGQLGSPASTKNALVKEEESDQHNHTSSASSSQRTSRRIKDEPDDDGISIETEEAQSAGVIIGMFTGNPQQDVPARIEIGMAAPSTVQTSPQGIMFHGDGPHEAEQFILERLDHVFPLNDTKWSSLGIFLLDHRSIIWLGPEQQLALVLVPKTQSCPRYSLLSPYDSFSGQTREMFIQKKDTVHYAGTYNCGEVPPGMSLVDKGFKGDRGTMTNLMAKACCEIQTQPEADRLGVAEFELVCDEGSIRVEWIAFRCVGYDGALCDALAGDSSDEDRSRSPRLRLKSEEVSSREGKRKLSVKEEPEDEIGAPNMKRVRRADTQ